MALTIRQRAGLRLVARHAADSRRPDPRPDAIGIIAAVVLAFVIAALLWIAMTGARL